MKQFVLFLLCGGIAASLNWGSRFLFSMFFGFKVAVALAYVVGMLTAFILMKSFVFQVQQKPLASQVSKFLAVNILALLQTLGVSVLLAEHAFPALGVVENAEAAAHLIGVLVPVVTSYFGHKFLTFK